MCITEKKKRMTKKKKSKMYTSNASKWEKNSKSNPKKLQKRKIKSKK
jgi:hypothetical protein